MRKRSVTLDAKLIKTTGLPRRRTLSSSRLPCRRPPVTCPRQIGPGNQARPKNVSDGWLGYQGHRREILVDRASTAPVANLDPDRRPIDRIKAALPDLKQQLPTRDRDDGSWGTAR